MAGENEKTEVKLKCIYGNKVRLKNLRTQVENEYTLVPFNQEKLTHNHISNYTRVGKAIWSKHVGDEVDIETPEKKWDRFRITHIENA